MPVSRWLRRQANLLYVNAARYQSLAAPPTSLQPWRRLTVGRVNH
jgi:hypothetical protein